MLCDIILIPYLILRRLSMLSSTKGECFVITDVDLSVLSVFFLLLALLIHEWEAYGGIFRMDRMWWRAGQNRGNFVLDHHLDPGIICFYLRWQDSFTLDKTDSCPANQTLVELCALRVIFVVNDTGILKIFVTHTSPRSNLTENKSLLDEFREWIVSDKCDFIGLQ